MLRFFRRYWPLILIAGVFAIAAFEEWSNANGPRQQTYAAAPPVSFPAPSPPQKTEESGSTQEPSAKGIQDVPAEDAIARYTEVLAWFTGILAAATVATGALIFWQVRLARTEFTATHRPKILVETVRITTKGGSRRNPVTMPDDTVPARAVLTLVNGGESVCRITEWQSVIYIQREEAAFTPFFDRIFANDDPEKWVLKPGEFGALEVEQAPIDDAWDDFVRSKGKGHAFVVGRITYEGGDGIRRVTGFCREYSRDTGRYHPVKNSEYEYAY